MLLHKGREKMFFSISIVDNMGSHGLQHGRFELGKAF